MNTVIALGLMAVAGYLYMNPGLLDGIMGGTAPGAGGAGSGSGTGSGSGAGGTVPGGSGA